MIKHTTQQPAPEVVSRDGRGGGGGGEWDESMGGVVCLVLPGVCSLFQSPKRQPTVPITAREAPPMTIRHHMKTLQLPPVSLLSFSVNYTNHFRQDGPRWLPAWKSITPVSATVGHRAQVNQVSHELIQVAWIRGGGGLGARQGNMLYFNLPSWAPFFFFLLFLFHPLFHHSHHILFAFSCGVSFSAPAEQLSCPRLQYSTDVWWVASLYLHVGMRAAHAEPFPPGADSSVCTASHCAVIWTDVDIMCRIFHWG